MFPGKDVGPGFSSSGFLSGGSDAVGSAEKKCRILRDAEGSAD